MNELYHVQFGNFLSLICQKNLQYNNENCIDFEIRFCCNTNLKQTISVIDSLSYSEKDIGASNLTISLKLQILKDSIFK